MNKIKNILLNTLIFIFVYLKKIFEQFIFEIIWLAGCWLVGCWLVGDLKLVEKILVRA